MPIWGLLPLAWKAGIIALVVLTAAGGIGGCVLKIKHDAVVAERDRVEKEKQQAIDRATQARELLRERCKDLAIEKCIPDGWFRD